MTSYPRLRKLGWIVLALMLPSFGVALWIRSVLRDIVVGLGSPDDSYRPCDAEIQLKIEIEGGRSVYTPLSSNRARIRKAEQRSLGVGIMTYLTAYRVECDRAVFDDLIRNARLAERTDPWMRVRFGEVLPEARAALDRGAPIFASSRFESESGGSPEGSHNCAVYDEATSLLYLWTQSIL